jgi:biopolymer transport protein ExbB
MAHDFSLWQVILKGGWTVVVLLLLSILVFGILFERLRAFARVQRSREDLMDSLGSFLSARDAAGGLSACGKDMSFLARVAAAGFKARLEKRPPEPVMEREAKEGLLELEANLPILATIGSTAPFIGLFGTVLGIIRAFKDLALANAGGAAVVSQGIAEALVATAAGLFVAISAVVIFNSFQARLERMAREAELVVSEINERLG